jgi:hypothetical protein
METNRNWLLFGNEFLFATWPDRVRPAPDQSTDPKGIWPDGGKCLDQLAAPGRGVVTTGMTVERANPMIATPGLLLRWGLSSLRGTIATRYSRWSFGDTPVS